VTLRGHGWSAAGLPAGLSSGLVTSWPEGAQVPRRPRRLARKAAWCLALTLWLLAVSALGGRTSPYSAPVSAPAASAPAASAPATSQAPTPPVSQSR
jgi:hypothetical protein